MPTLEQCRHTRSQLLGRRQPREARLRILRKYICPWRGIFTGQLEDNPTAKQMLRFTRAASSAALRSASGMTSGMTPANAPWFKCDFANPRLLELPGARAWLDQVDRILRETLQSGGFYQAIQDFNLDLVWSGSALIYAEKSQREDESTVRFSTEQQGTWAVALTREGRLHQVLRQLSVHPWDLAATFGEERLSPRSRQRLKNNSAEITTVWHLVCPATDGGPHPFLSLYWEEGAENFLSQSGYYEMPFFFTCWHEGITAYGTGPGDDALPDALQMDKLERLKLEGLSKIISPPMVAPVSLKGSLNLGPGAINYTNEPQQVRPVLDLSPFAASLSHLREEIHTVAQRLDDALLASVFSSMPLSQRPAGMSATEFLERKRESLQQLGPVISAYEPNVLTPLLFRALQINDRASKIPLPPDSLANEELFLQMRFVSPMANALRQTQAETARALFQDVAMIAQAAANPEVLDKVDVDQLVDELATGLGAPGSIVRADADVQTLRQQRAQAQARQQDMQQQLAITRGQAAQASAMRDEAQAANLMASLQNQGAI